MPFKAHEHPPMGPGGTARAQAAALFDGLLAELWARGDDSVSNRALAERCLKVDEKQVRQYRDGRKALPVSALLVLPIPLVEDLVGRILDARAGGRPVRRAVSVLRRALGSLAPRQVPAADRHELARALVEARDQIDALIRDLARLGDS